MMGIGLIILSLDQFLLVSDGIQMGVIASGQQSGVQETSVEVDDDVEREGHVKAQKGMILPFEPLALTFHNVSYYVDMPSVSVF
jgi:hypothetical protein